MEKFTIPITVELTISLKGVSEVPRSGILGTLPLDEAAGLFYGD